MFLWDSVVAVVDVVVLDAKEIVFVDERWRRRRHRDGQRHVREVGQGFDHHEVGSGRGALKTDPGELSRHKWDRSAGGKNLRKFLFLNCEWCYKESFRQNLRYPCLSNLIGNSKIFNQSECSKLIWNFSLLDRTFVRPFSLPFVD